MGEQLPQGGDPAAAQALAERLQTVTGTQVTFIALDGTVLGESDPKLPSGGSPVARPEVARALKGEVGQETRPSGPQGEPFLFVAVPIERQGEIVGVTRASTSLAPQSAALRRLTALILAGGFEGLVALPSRGLPILQGVSAKGSCGPCCCRTRPRAAGWPGRPRPRCWPSG